jgi:ribosome maturation factor RimP
VSGQIRHLARNDSGKMSWQQALERTVIGLGYDLVDVERSAGGLLCVTIDRQPGHVYSTGPGVAIVVEDCEIVTRQLQFLLEVEAVEYARLEVSSPGIDRPLKKPSDWQRFLGSAVEITLLEPFQGRRKWRGELVAGNSDMAWRLLLPLDKPVSRTSAKRAAKAAAAGEAADASTVQRTLDFLLDEVREARLVPIVDFKGRRGAGPEDDDGQGLGQLPEDQKVDGGQD